MSEFYRDNRVLQRRELWDAEGRVASIPASNLKRMTQDKSYGSDWLRERWAPKKEFGSFPPPERHED